MQHKTQFSTSAHLGRPVLPPQTDDLLTPNPPPGATAPPTGRLKQLIGRELHFARSHDLRRAGAVRML